MSSTNAGPFTENKLQLNSERIKVVLTRLNRMGIDRETIKEIYSFIRHARPSEYATLSPNYLILRTGLPRIKVLNFLVFAVKEGLFEFSWDILCPQCKSLTSAYANLSELQQREHCNACSNNFMTFADENIQVSIRLHPSVLANDSLSFSRSLKRDAGYDVTLALDFIELPAFREHLKMMIPSIRQSIKLSRITVMFTDLKNSTYFYNQIGDVNAYQMVRDHFDILRDSITKSSGYIIKSMGDAVLAIFRKPVDALLAARKFRREIEKYALETKPKSRLYIKVGINSGPALIVNLNGMIDLFGKTINLGARIVDFSDEKSIGVGQSIIDDRDALRYLHEEDLAYSLQEKSLRNFGDSGRVYSIIM